MLKFSLVWFFEIFAEPQTKLFLYRNFFDCYLKKYLLRFHHHQLKSASELSKKRINMLGSKYFLSTFYHCSYIYGCGKYGLTTYFMYITEIINYYIKNSEKGTRDMSQAVVVEEVERW